MMRKIILILTSLVLSLSVQVASAQFDLDKPVLVIPATHEDKEYRWNVEKNPAGVSVDLIASEQQSAKGVHFSLVIRTRPGDVLDVLQVFIVDRALHNYQHVRPTRTEGGSYAFDFAPPEADQYRFEIVFRSTKSWVNVSKDIKLAKSPAAKKPDEPEGYGVKLKRYPNIFYSEHVSTLVYMLSYKGQPIKELEAIDGADIHVASWSEALDDFVYATSRQNTGGPEVPVSAVFLRPGKRAVFAEFKHKGVVIPIETVVSVNDEPKQTPAHP